MQELKAQKIWVCWRYTMVKGRRTKKLFSAYGTATGTDAPHRHSWVTYDEAVAAAEEKCFDGVGFIIPEGYVFLDIDHRGLDDPLVQTMLRRFDTYAEHSVSGGGIHFYGKCDREKIPSYIDGKGQRKLDKTYYTKHPKKGITDKMKSVRLAQIFSSERGGKPDAERCSVEDLPTKCGQKRCVKMAVLNLSVIP